MEEPMSAFAVYNSNKKDKKKRNRKRNNKNQTPASDPKVAENVPEEVINKIASKVNKKLKLKKEPKIINKKKSHKKKKTQKAKVIVRNQKLRPTVQEHSDYTSESDNVPDLTVPRKMIPILQPVDYDSACSHSSNESYDFTPVQTDSVEEGLKLFKWMLAPYCHKKFLNEIWEKGPLHIERKNPKYYNEIISTPAIDNMLRTEDVQYSKNIDITTYVDGKRETHNPEGRALPHLVWDFYLCGCSVRILNPQSYLPKIHLLNATLQEFFTSFVGANVYLTPPDSQGFAPHYDDIEAFVLQAEGKKRWRIYNPRHRNEVLTRISSGNFTDDDIGEPVLEVILKAGDMLYFPRGFIHQAEAIDGEHSLHVTISMHQKHSWADLFEKMIPAALETAITNNVELRRGLPFDIFHHFGYAISDQNSQRKKELENVIKNLFDKVKDYISIDNAVDQMHRQFQESALPPVLTDVEKAVTVYGDSDTMIENGKVVNRVEMNLDTRIRLLRKNILRLALEDGIKIYFHSDNSIEYHGHELSFMEVNEELVPAIETLILAYPNYVAVEDLDIEDEAKKLDLADALWGRGVIMTEYPLENVDD